VTIVVDASLIIAWLLREERSSDAEAIARAIIEEGAWVPQLFSIEVANVLLQAVRKKRIDASYAEEQLRRLEDISLSIDTETNDHAWAATFRLAADEGLTVYDSTYLELALRRDAILATLDDDLADAARRRGLTVVP
jgi:predicted nucleic acid-binding protein